MVSARDAVTLCSTIFCTHTIFTPTLAEVWLEVGLFVGHWGMTPSYVALEIPPRCGSTRSHVGSRSPRARDSTMASASGPFGLKKANFTNLI